MPELAEVALFANDINLHVKGRKLTALRYNNVGDHWGKTIAPTNVRDSLWNMREQVVVASSRGKSLYLTANGMSVTAKLGMTGRFAKEKPKESFEKHVFLELGFDDCSIWYVDYRRFGRLSVTPTKECENHIGGFNEAFFLRTRDELNSIVSNSLKDFKKIPRISWLLKHGPQTGVGNYLANEALGRLDLSPFEPCQSPEGAVNLLLECGEIARESFEEGGNSFAGGYFRLDGEPGKYDSHCRFYQAAEVPRSIFRGRPVYSKFQNTTKEKPL